MTGRMARRRSDYTFGVAARRVADYTLRASIFRSCCVVIIALALLLDTSPGWTWVAPGLASLGCYQATSVSVAVLRGTVPREPVASWAYRSAVEQHGRHIPNISGIIEGLSAILFGAVAVYGLTDLAARLVVLVSAVGWTSSVFGAVFTDPAFYNPDDDPPGWLEVTRTAAGPILAVVGCALVSLGEWPSLGRWTAYAICGGLVGVTLRVRETDRGMVYAHEQSGESELDGRNLVLEQAHSQLSGPLAVALQMSDSLRGAYPALHEQIRVARVRLQQLTALDQLSVRDTALPGSLVRAVEWLARPYGVPSRVRIDPTVLDDDDHDIARIVLGDLVTNAVKSGATRVGVTLERNGPTLVLTVSDDIGNFPKQSWRAPGSSLERLASVLEARRGDLELFTDDGGSRVKARWRERSR